MARTLLAFGAGNIGLSFVGQIFARSGYRVIFADTDAEVLERLRRYDGYRVALLDPAGGSEELEISPVETVDARDTGAVGALLRDRPLIATSVGLRAFSDVVRSVADAAARAAVDPAALDIVAAENIHDPRSVALDVLGDNAPGIHACSVGKMVPFQERGASSGKIVVRAEAFNTLIVDGTDWRGPVPHDVPWIRVVENIEAWMDRKLYVHNLGHAACAWRARASDPEITTIAEAIARPSIERWTRHVMYAAVELVARAYPGAFVPGDLQEHAEELLFRFGNAALGDTVERVGRDLERKLGRHDRLIGAMRLAARLSRGVATTGTRAASDGEIGATDHGASVEACAATILPLFADVARDAVRFGVEGLSEWPADIEVTKRAAVPPLSKVVADVAPLSGDDPNDQVVIHALE